MKAGLVGRWARAAVACAAVGFGFNAAAETIPSLPERTDEGYDASPYVVNGVDGPLVELKRLSGAATLPVQETSGATYRTIVNGTANEFHFDGGTWNLYNPFGVLSNCQLNFAGGSGENQTANRIYVHGGAITGGRMQFVAAAEENILCFDGGQHVFNGGVGFVSSSRSGSGLTPRTYTVEVSGAGTSFKTTGRPYLVSDDNNNARSGHAQDTLLIRVCDGATFESNDYLIDRGEAHYRYEISNGATFKINSFAYVGYGANHLADIVVNDSTFTVNGNWMGRNDRTAFAATNSVISLGSSSSGAYLTYDLKDCTVSNLSGIQGTAVVSGGSINVASVSGNGRAAFSDLTLKGQSCISASGTDAQLFLTNLTVGSGFYLGYVGNGAGKKGTVTFSGGTYLNEYYEFSIATGAGSEGTVNFEDGAYTFNYMQAVFEPRNTFHIGIDGTGTFNMRGGTVTGYSPILAENAGSTGVLNLDGGTWFVKGLRVGAGTSVLNGDGGTIVPRVANESFIAGLSQATLGAKGLLIDTRTTGCALTVPQAFANKAGTDAGVLRLKGGSPITLTGSSTCAKIRIEGGGHVVAADQGATVEVIGGSRLNFADGAANAVTLGGLVLGEASAAGILAVDPDDVITVTGELDFPNAFVALNGTFAEGEHVLVRTTSPELPSAVRTAWARTSVAEGAVAGLVYRFATTVDDGVEVLTLVIEQPKELGGNVNWKGGSDWASDASWQGGKRPSDTEIATFTEDATTKSVSLSEPVTIGALEFNADGYAVSGEGTVTLSPAVSGYVTAAGGANEVSVGVSFGGEYPVTVGEDAKLVLSGPLTGGVPVKRGAGELELSGENSFSGGIRAEEGTLSVVGADAFGYNGAAPANDIVLSGGELVYRGDAAGETTAVSLAPAQEGTDVTRVTVETPLVTGAYAPVSGSFEKRGAGNLTLGAVNGRELTPGEGDIAVAEGALTFKGTTADAMTLAKKVSVGVAEVEPTATPELVLDGLRVNGGTFAVADKAALTMKNGAVAYSTSWTIKSTNTVTLDKAVLVGRSTLKLGSATTDPTVLRVTNGGRISTYADTYPAVWNGALDAVFDNSILTRTSRISYEYDFDYAFFPIFLQATGAASGSILFRNKAEFACRGLQRTSHTVRPAGATKDENPYYTNAVSIVFDDAVFSCANYSLDFVVPHPQSYVTEVRAGGLTIDLISSSGMTIHKALTGVGGITVKGSGKTLVFDREMDRLTADSWSSFFYLEGDHPTYCCEGVLKVESGVTVKLKAGSVRPDAKVELAAGATLDLDGAAISLGSVGGAGTVRNGTLAVDTLAIKEGAPVFTCPVSGIRAIDCGRTEDDPVVLQKGVYPVATFTGRAAGSMLVRVVGTGHPGKYVGTLTVDANGVATLSGIARKGLLLMVR